MATLSQNITQAISDFNSIKTAILNKGVSVPSNTPTSQYAGKITDIPTGDDTLIKGMIDGSLTSITLPYGLTSIRKNCFNQSEFTSIIIPDTVTQINESAFAYCRNLRNVTLSNNLTVLSETAFLNCSSLNSIAIPVGITTLEEQVFFNCSSLSSVTLPNEITEFKRNAFYGCSNLASINIPSALIIIRDGAFSGCSSLTSLVIPGTIVYIDHYAFDGCTALSNVTLGNGFDADHLDLSASTLYSAQTIVSWLNALNDRTGLSAYTLIIGSTNIAKLTAQEIAIATNKNWNLA